MSEVARLHAAARSSVVTRRCLALRVRAAALVDCVSWTRFQEELRLALIGGDGRPARTALMGAQAGAQACSSDVGVVAKARR